MALHSRATIIEGFIDYLAISMRDLLAGRVFGRLRCPEAEIFKDMPYYLRIGSLCSDGDVLQERGSSMLLDLGLSVRAFPVVRLHRCLKYNSLRGKKNPVVLLPQWRQK